MKKFSLYIFFLFLAVSISAQEIQNASNIWYFGNRAGLDFNVDPPVALTDGQLNTVEGVASISDDDGNLLFYTDGITVWDKTHVAMPNANGTLNGHISSTQSGLIVPNLSDPDLYYIFTTTELGGSDGLSYSIVDIELAGNGTTGAPLGNIAAGSLNIQLETPVTEKITGVLKSDYSGYWIIAHGWNSNEFLAYEVSCDGVNETPVVSSIGNIHSGGTDNINAVGYMKATFDGQRLALVNRTNNTIDLYNFDPSTGIVSNEIEITPTNTLIYGIEFSPSGQYLYIGGQTIISRYEIGSGILSNIAVDNPQDLNTSNVVRALQLGPDGNIYVSVRFRDYISIIFDPDESDASLTTNGIFLDPDGAGRYCRFGLPNVFYFDRFPPDTLIVATCPDVLFEFDGSFYLGGTINEINLLTAEGCDSTFYLLVEELEALSDFLEVDACEGSYYSYDSNIEILAGTTETVTSINDEGCMTTLTITVNELEAFNETLEVEVCEGSSYDYNGVPIAAGTEDIFTFTSSSGCDSLVTVVVNATNLIEENIIVELCSGDTYLFNDQEYPIGTDTSIFIMSQLDCDTLITISVLLSPEVNFDLMVEMDCWNSVGGSISIENISGGVPPFEYSLDGLIFSTDTLLNNLEANTYEVFVRDANLCIYEQETEIFEISELLINVPETILPCAEDSVLVSLDLIEGNPIGVNWTWENGSQGNTIFVDQPGVYTVEVSNECQTLLEDVEVVLEADTRNDLMYIPNVFSPNDDGINDQFKIYAATDIEVIDFEIQIFNRWGALMFKSNDIHSSWDGFFKNTPIKTGTYVYWLKADVIACKRAINIFKKGDITIVQ